MMTTRPSVFKEQKGGQLLGSSVNKGERPERWAGLLSRALWPCQGVVLRKYHLAAAERMDWKQGDQLGGCGLL